MVGGAVTLAAHRAALAAAGRIEATQRIPELNTRVWAEHAALCAAFGVAEESRAVVEGPGGLAAWRDGDDAPFTLAGLDCVSDPWLPFGAGELIAALPGLLAALVEHAGPAARLATDTFALPTPPSADERRHFVWLQSPVAQIPTRAEDYLPALKPKRRKALRRAREVLEAGGLRVTLDATPADDGELERVAAWQARRFGDEDFGYALRQHLFVAATARALPDAALTLRAWWDGAPVLLAGYVIRGDRVTAQATARDPDRCPSGLGTLADVLAIERLAGGPLRVFDPTCRLSLADPPAIGVAKRAVVNADHHKPLLVVGAAADGEPIEPRLDATGWRLPAAPVVLGEPA